ncbi:hypothetical protein [Pseudomonas sp. FP2309]|uniref:hypothetical protein n=1 Tax=Pseudomonas sp. FP2309 TaxID=2954091 RepID=UPI002736C429|nr:hypothetical protein [Pseudomonas sp. FP2309]WLH68817.1 hypothetical protein PSH59_01505 [Pseudomonas sp. FP2309]
MKIKCQSFVVDADVARAAGLSEHPVSKGARSVLQAILNSDARAVFCPKLKEEWKQHKSIFSTRWQSSMTAKKKIDHIISTSNISEFIEISQVTDAQKAIAQKDAHVVDAALSIKSIIASNDNAARAVFKILGQFSGSVGELIWVSPTTECDRLLDLIGSTAYVPNEWILKTDNH